MSKHILRATLLLVSILCAHAHSFGEGASHVKARLISPTSTLALGSANPLALEMAVEDGWHIYWKNPGDTGLPPKLKADGEGLKLSDFDWPVPERLPNGPLVSYGYQGTVTLPFSATVENGQAGEKKTWSIEAKWLVCKDVCVPEKTRFTLAGTLSAESDPRSGTKPPSAGRPQPILTSEWQPSVQVQGGKWIIHLKAPRLNQAEQAAKVFVENEGLVKTQPEALARFTPEGDLQIELLPTRPDADFPAQLAIVLAWDTHAVRIEIPHSALAAAETPIAGLGEILRMALFAFLGGLVLNLMPCVFPMLSIKLLGVVRDAGSAPGKVRAHGALYTVGVLATFWIMVGALLILKHVGKEVGWGFQLQSPGFVVFLLLLFFFMALNLIGVFEVGSRLMGVGGNLTQGDGAASALASGVLSVVVASPCTAPFMGVAMGFALAQPAYVAFGVFTSLGLGLALPFLALTFAPQLASRLPRPGPWMATLKTALAFPLFATVAWLVWVLQLQVGADSLLKILLAVVCAGGAAWAYGQWAQLAERPRGKIWGHAAALGFVAATCALFWGPLHPRTDKIDWQAYSPAKLEELLAQSKPVFIDYTAAWCITCQVNEQVALTSSDVIAKFKEKGIVTLRADWTSEDPEITKSLTGLGRSGVPLYVLHSRGPASQPKILPQILTPEIVIKELDGL